MLSLTGEISPSIGNLHSLQHLWVIQSPCPLQRFIWFCIRDSRRAVCDHAISFQRQPHVLCCCTGYLLMSTALLHTILKNLSKGGFVTGIWVRIIFRDRYLRKSATASAWFTCKLSVELLQCYCSIFQQIVTVNRNRRRRARRFQ
jgi:hypothetical protein